MGTGECFYKELWIELTKERYNNVDGWGYAMNITKVAI